MNTCPYCGATLSNQALICWKCGKTQPGGTYVRLGNKRYRVPRELEPQNSPLDNVRAVYSRIWLWIWWTLALSLTVAYEFRLFTLFRGYEYLERDNPGYTERRVLPIVFT